MSLMKTQSLRVARLEAYRGRNRLTGGYSKTADHSPNIEMSTAKPPTRSVESKGAGTQRCLPVLQGHRYASWR